MADFVIPNKQRLRRVERLELWPRDFDETLRFWRRLGLQSTVKGDPGRRTATMRAGDLHLAFHEDEGRAGDRRTSPLAAFRLVLSVRELDAFCEELRGKGVDVPAAGRHHGLTRGVELVDPNGIRVLLEDAG